MSEPRKVRGAVEDNSANTIFLQIKYGRICQISKVPKEGFNEITVANPTTGANVIKYVKPYRLLEGYIDKIAWYDSGERFDVQYRSWKITLNANGQIYILDLAFESTPSRRFMQTAENIDFNEPLEIRAWNDKLDGSLAIGFFQNEVSVRAVYTKENPGECPPAIQKKVAGKMTYNFDDMYDFLYNRMLDVVIPEVQKCSEERKAWKEEVHTEYSGTPVGSDIPVDDDDIPF